MFANLPEILREYGIPADVRILMLLRKSIEKDLVRTFGDLFQVLRSIVVKHPSMMGPYTRAYYRYFLNIDISCGEALDDAIKRSDTFRRWLESKLGRQTDLSELDMEEWVEKFISTVHMSSFDISQIIDGEEIFRKDKGDTQDKDGPGREEHRMLDRIVDYSNMDIDELLERMKEVAREQKFRHSGGSHWIGTDGYSPYGHGGAAKGGIRAGGTGGGKMARAVFNDARYFPVDMDAFLSDDNIDAALAALKGTTETSAEEILDIDLTIETGLKRGGLFLPEMMEKLEQKVQILLMIDNGGYSMDPYIDIVQKLFRKMKTRFSHDLEVFYFHNTIYNRIYTDSRRAKYVSVDRFLQHDPSYSVFVIGDAAMAPWELDETSLISWGRIREKFSKTVWLNPEPVRHWRYTITTSYLSKIIPMFPLTPKGIEEAVVHINRQKR